MRAPAARGLEKIRPIAAARRRPPAAAAAPRPEPRARALPQVRVEGVLALWKGLLPVYCRQAPFNMLNYMLMETLLSTFAGRTI